MIKQRKMKMDSCTIKYRGSCLRPKTDSKDPVERAEVITNPTPICGDIMPQRNELNAP